MTDPATTDNDSWYSGIWNRISGAVGDAYDKVTNRVSTAFNENVVAPVKEAFNPMKWIKSICESVFGKETLHGILETVTSFFGGDDKEAFGSGTFLGDLKQWENELEAGMPQAAPTPAVQPQSAPAPH